MGEVYLKREVAIKVLPKSSRGMREALTPPTERGF